MKMQGNRPYRWLSRFSCDASSSSHGPQDSPVMAGKAKHEPKKAEAKKSGTDTSQETDLLRSQLWEGRRSPSR